jgi:hypothetical protein
MSSRRRNSKKNLGNSISEIQRRIRRMERRPIRTRLQNRVIKASAIAPSTITAEEVDFGTALLTSENPADVVDNPKDGLLIIDPDTNSASIYSEAQGDYVDVTDPTAQATADSASSAATTAYNAAIASLQPSANTIVNASNQITAVNTNGITVYSGGSTTTGARIVMNSAGIAGFDATSTNSSTGATFSISASTGAAVFKGSIQSGSTISGATITGGTIQTAASGTRIELTSAASNRIDFYGSATTQGVITVNDYRIFVYAPASTLGGGAVLSLYGDQQPIYPNGIFMTGGPSLDLAFAMSSTTISLGSGATYKLRVTSLGTTVDGAAGEGNYMLRNARISTTSVTSGNASGTTDGNLYLVRES